SGTPYSAYVQGSCSGGSDLSEWTLGVVFTPGLTQIGDGATTNTNFPIYSCTAYNYTQQIYPAASYTGEPYITKIRFKYISSGTILANWSDWTVYMGNTTETDFASTTSWIPVGSLQQVFSGTVNPVADEWMEIALNPGFLWDGSSNIVVAVDENSSGTSCTATWASFTSVTNSGIYRRTTTDIDPAAPGTATSRSGTLAQAQFLGGAVPSCMPPTALLLTSVGTSTGSFSWTASTSGPAGYQWEVRSSGLGGSGATGLEDSGSTSGTSASTSGLASNSAYNVYVRANCGSGDFSAWVGPMAFTTGAACGDSFTDTGGASADYGNNENWTKTYCRTTPGDQVRVLFSSFNTEANWDKLFIFNGPDVNAPKFASTA